ncbi:MAG: hypothetical protein KatS3mg110_2384 [Pirellulaceae bacterium]|nr:MAG: hypothetical protein KatS3mg110_1925 [Pirellulaceae bacterium]GIW94343.1 MAG: hypothetical protein KatS3mg110_2384 [Pirellulaceae bacterium]
MSRCSAGENVYQHYACLLEPIALALAAEDGLPSVIWA